MTSTARPGRPLRCIAVALLLLAVACGASPAEDVAGPTETGADAGSTGSQAGAAGTEGTGAVGSRDCTYDGVFTEVEGLEGQQRTDRLVELAQDEGELNVYTSNTDLADQSELFTEAYDVEVSVYRAQSNQVLQRVLQEAQAGFAGADVLENNSKEMAAANSEGLLQEYEGPVTEGLVDAALQDGWIASRLTVFTVSWNTDVVQEPPTSYEDLADPRFAGLIMMEPRAFEWYMALSGHFIDQGMTQDEVDELFSQIAANATQVTGNTSLANFLASGEFGLSTSVYSHLVDELIATGAPISHSPAIEPVVVGPLGPGLICTAQNPASAMLFFEWVLTDAQELLLEDFRVPTRESVQVGDLQGVETVPVDVEQLVDEGAEWEQRYQEVLRNAQAEPAG